MSADEEVEGEIRKKSVEKLMQSVRKADDGSYAFLIGAGVSAEEPANIKTAGELIEEFQADLYDQKGSNDADVDEWAEDYQDEHMGDGQNEYGFWFSEVYPVPGNRRERITDLVEEDGGERVEPPFCQIVLAKMMADGIVSHTFTPNFDNLLFDAFHEFAADRPLFIDHREKASQFNMSGERPAIVKLHGDYRHYTQNTADETTTLDAEIRDRFQQSLGEYGLIVVGYGGNDESIMRELESEAISEYGLFWCKREQDGLSENAEAVLRESEDAYLVEIEDADTFFRRLWENIDRVELPQPDDIMERAEERRDRIQRRMHGDSGSSAEKSEEDGKPAETESRIWDARNLRTDGEYERAIEILQDVLDDEPDNARAHFQLGWVHRVRGDLESAVECYDQVLELDPKNYYAYYNRGIARNGLGEYEAAINDYTRAIELDPESVSARKNRSEARILAGEFEDAREDAREAESLSDDIEDEAVSGLLGLIAKFLLDEDVSDTESEYRSLCEEEFTVHSWDFEALDSWLDDADLPSEKEERIREWIDLLREHEE